MAQLDNYFGRLLRSFQVYEGCNTKHIEKMYVFGQKC